MSDNETLTFGNLPRDPELRALQIVGTVLTELPTDDARARVTRYVLDRYGQVKS